MTHRHRMLLKWARLVHVYVTLLGLALILFFAVTGFMLNHDDWFGFDEPYTQTATGAVPTGLLQGPDKLAIVELLRKDFGASGVMDSFETEEDAVKVVFRGPGQKFEANIQRIDGATTTTRELRGLFGVLADLHRGKATGSAWKLIIDAVCIVLLIISTTGLVLWHSLRGRGKHGLAVMGLGLAIGVVVYYALVP
jgi:uncharacterized protein